MLTINDKAMLMNTLFQFLYLAYFFVAMILILNLVSKAFKRSVLWGFTCLLFPPGTYIYCKKNWQAVKNLVMPILILVAGSLLFKLLTMLIK